MSWFSTNVYDPGWAEGGGWMGDLGGGKKEQTSKSELDPETQTFRGEMFDFFRNNIQNSQYTPYTGQRFAPNNQNLDSYFQGAGAFGTAGAPSGIQGANTFQGTFAGPTNYQSTYQAPNIGSTFNAPTTYQSAYQAPDIRSTFGAPTNYRSTYQAPDIRSTFGAPTNFQSTYVAPDIRSTFQAPDLKYMSASDYRTRTDARMNPYEDQVVQQTLSDIDREQALAQNRAGADVAKAKAFGSRGELYQAETNRQFADAKARTAANLRQQGYRDALSSVDAEQARTQQLGLQGAGMAADDAARAQGMTLDSNKFAAGQSMDAARLREQSRGMSADDAARAQGMTLDSNQFAAGQGLDAARLREQSRGMAADDQARYQNMMLNSNQFAAGQGMDANRLGLQAAGMAADDAARAQNMMLNSNQFAAGQDMDALRLRLQAAGMSADDAARAAQLRLSGGQALTNDQLTRLQALGAAGGVEQGLTQQQRDFDYQQWQEGQNFDLNKLNAYISTLSGTPYGQTSTTNLYSNPLSGATGTALSLAALYGLLN